MIAGAGPAPISASLLTVCDDADVVGALAARAGDLAGDGGAGGDARAVERLADHQVAGGDVADRQRVPEIEPVNCGAGAPPKVVEGVWVIADAGRAIARRRSRSAPVSTKLASVGASGRRSMLPVLVIELTEPDWSMIAPTAAAGGGCESVIAAAMVPVLTIAPTLAPGGDDDALHRLRRRGGDAAALIVPSLTICAAVTPAPMLIAVASALSAEALTEPVTWTPPVRFDRAARRAQLDARWRRPAPAELGVVSLS